MSAGPRLPLPALLWAVGSTLAGAAVGLTVSLFRGGGVDGTTVLIGVLLGNVVAVTVLVSSAVLFPRLRSWPPAARAALLAICLLSGAAAGTALVLYLFPLYVLRDYRQALALAGINGLLTVTVGSVVFAYETLGLRLAESLREVEEVRLVEARLREEAARAELDALQARINPHFFFNTLNTITSLLDDDTERAQDVVQSLADLFRYTFKASTSSVPLSEELEFVERYLDIERARFGQRLQVRWQVDPSARELSIPGLVLQPLVENAVGHGIAPEPAGGTVTIVARRHDGGLRVEVTDDGVGLDGAAPIRPGHGLGNVRRRLRTLFGDRGRLSVEPGADGRGTRSVLELPARVVEPAPRAAVGGQAR